MSVVCVCVFLRSFLMGKEELRKSTSAPDRNQSVRCQQIERRFGCDFAERSAILIYQESPNGGSQMGA